MNLQIRDPRAHALAKQLAERRGVSMTKAVIDACKRSWIGCNRRWHRSDGLWLSGSRPSRIGLQPKPG